MKTLIFIFFFEDLNILVDNFMRSLKVTLKAIKTFQG